MTRLRSLTQAEADHITHVIQRALGEAFFVKHDGTFADCGFPEVLYLKIQKGVRVAHAKIHVDVPDALKMTSSDTDQMIALLRQQVAEFFG